MKNYAGPAEIMYHTGLSAGMIRGAKYALLPGDPGRVEGLAKALDENALFVASHRDYTTWLARVENAPVLVMSTGMGGPCVTFAVEELARLGVETFISKRGFPSAPTASGRDRNGMTASAAMY